MRTMGVMQHDAHVTSGERDISSPALREESLAKETPKTMEELHQVTSKEKSHQENAAKASLRVVSNCPYTSKTFASASGYVTSGYSTYSSSTDCFWIIAPPAATNVSLTFQMFDVEYTSTCRYDQVYIYSCTTASCTSSTRKLLRTMCGTMSRIVNPVTSPTGFMKIRFTTDSSVNKRGFCATWGTGAVCPTSPSPPVLRVYRENVLRPLYSSLVGLSLAQVEVVTTSRVTYMRYALSTDTQPTPTCDCTNWEDEASCPNTVKNGSKLVLYRKGATSRTYLKVNVIACQQYPDVTLTSSTANYGNYFLDPPRVRLFFPVNIQTIPAITSTTAVNASTTVLTNSSTLPEASADASAPLRESDATTTPTVPVLVPVLVPLCGNLSALDEWQKIVESRLNASQVLPQQISVNVSRLSETAEVSGEVLATSNVQAATIINVLLDHRKEMQEALTRACPLLTASQEMSISTSSIFTKSARGEGPDASSVLSVADSSCDRSGLRVAL